MSGLVEGDIIAARKVVLHKTARVFGNLETPSLVVEEGAALDGHVNMPGSEGKAALKAAQAGSRKQPAEPPSPMDAALPKLPEA